LALGLVGVLFGCGDAGPRTVQVNGTVTRAGKPVAHVMLHFSPESGRASWGSSDEQGNFSLRFDKKREGAVVGSHRVYVEFRPQSVREEELMSRGQWSPHPDYKAIVEKYGSLAGTPLKVEVGPEDPQTITIKLD